MCVMVYAVCCVLCAVLWWFMLCAVCFGLCAVCSVLCAVSSDFSQKFNGYIPGGIAGDVVVLAAFS